MIEPQKIIWEHVKHFKKEEWQKDPNKVAVKLVYLLDKIRDISGYPIKIHVAYDTSGHSPHSYHYIGMAVDFHWDVPTKEFPYLEQYNLLTLFRSIGGIGFYPYWNNPGWHIDLREGDQRLIWYRDEKWQYHYDPKKVFKKIVECSNK